MSFSEAISNQLLDQVFGGGAAYAAPDPLWLALVTEEPVGDVVVEAAYAGYARIEVQSSQFAAAAGKQRLSTVAFAFPACDPGGDDVLVSWVALFTDAFAGDLVLTGVTGSELEITEGVIPTLDVGALALTWS